MNNWFECKVSYTKTLENGYDKKVTESYLLDALSFTEAETRAIEEVRPYISGEFTIEGIKKIQLAELFIDGAEEGDKYYKAKTFLVTLDERNGQEKKKGAQMLVRASDIERALYRLVDGMKGTLSDYEIASITETSIIDVIPYEVEDTTADNSED